MTTSGPSPSAAHAAPTEAEPEPVPIAGATAEPGRALRWVIITLAFACGASVANLYYAQPCSACSATPST